MTDPVIGYDPQTVKAHPKEQWAAVEFLQEYRLGEDDESNFDVLLSVRKGKIVYMGPMKKPKKKAKKKKTK